MENTVAGGHHRTILLVTIGMRPSMAMSLNGTESVLLLRGIIPPACHAQSSTEKKEKEVTHILMMSMTGEEENSEFGSIEMSQHIARMTNHTRHQLHLQNGTGLQDFLHHQ